jgi:hypothetical protein
MASIDRSLRGDAAGMPSLLLFVVGVLGKRAVGGSWRMPVLVRGGSVTRAGSYLLQGGAR